MNVRTLILAAAALFVATPGPARADGPGYAPRTHTASRTDERALGVPARRFRAERFRRVEPVPGSSYGPAPLVRAYLPRNHAVPMYNEPPTR